MYMNVWKWGNKRAYVCVFLIYPDQWEWHAGLRYAVSATLCMGCYWQVVGREPSAWAGTAQRETSRSLLDAALGHLLEVRIRVWVIGCFKGSMACNWPQDRCRHYYIQMYNPNHVTIMQITSGFNWRWFLKISLCHPVISWTGWKMSNNVCQHFYVYVFFR